MNTTKVDRDALKILIDYGKAIHPAYIPYLLSDIDTLESELEKTRKLLAEAHRIFTTLDGPGADVWVEEYKATLDTTRQKTTD